MKIELLLGKRKDVIFLHIPGYLAIDPSLDQIEDLELNLTDIIKQLQDYRMKQNHD